MISNITIRSHIKSDYFTLLCVYAYYVYFAFLSIIGLSQNSILLIVFHSLVFLIAFCKLAKFFLKERRILFVELLIICFVIFVFISYAVSQSKYGFSETSSDTLKDFVAKSLPAIMIGIVSARERKLQSVSNGIPVIIAFFTLFCFNILFKSFLYSISPFNWDNMLFINYQNASYTAAFCSCLCLYKLFFENDKLKKWVKFFYFLSLAVCSLTSLYSGGRGGVVVIVLDFMICFFVYFFRGKITTKKIAFLVFICLVAVGLLIVVATNGYLKNGFERAFEFIDSSGGINWEGTSGRLDIYKQCISAWLKSPLFGYGICGSPRIGIDRSHNIFLDIMIDGGVLYLFAWTFVLFWSFARCFKKMKNDNKYALILLILVSDFAMLNFSLVYMRSIALWFSITFLLVDYSLDRRKTNEYSCFNKCLSATR